MADSHDTDIPTLDALARRYLDLWQDQWVAVAGDPVTAENITRWFQIMAQGAMNFSPFAGMASGGGWDTRPPPRASAESSPSPESASPRPAEEPSWPPPPLPPIFRLWPSDAFGARTAAGSDGPGRDDGASAARTAAPSPASGGRADGTPEFSDRLALLEERLAGLEAGVARPRFRSRRPNRGGGG